MNIFNWKNPPLCTVKISWLLKNCCLHCFNLGLWSQTTWFRLRSDCSKSCLILWPYWSLSLSSPGGAVQKLCAKLWRNLPVWTDCYLNTNKHKHNQKMFSVNSASCCKNEDVCIILEVPYTNKLFICYRWNTPGYEKQSAISECEYYFENCKDCFEQETNCSFQLYFKGETLHCLCK